MGNLRSKFGKNRSTNYVTFLSTDAGRTDGRTDGRTVYVILYSVQCICIALHWTDNECTRGAEIDLSMFSMFSRTEAHTKTGPHKPENVGHQRPNSTLHITIYRHSQRLPSLD